MKEVYRRCCGMDVHKETVVACVLPPDGKVGDPVKKVFGTFRKDLTRMRGWLKLLKVTDIAMESTGVYWRPIWNVLEDQGFERLLLANPVQVKALAGRKNDGRDLPAHRRVYAGPAPGPEPGATASFGNCVTCCATVCRFSSNATRLTTRFGTCSKPPM
jgi:transposase